jgi:hypothetical protein
MRILLLGVLGVAASFTATACGGSSCEDAVANAAKIYGFGGSTYGSMRAEGIQKCKAEKWPEKMRSCVVAAKNRSDVDGCEKYMHESSGGGDDYGKKSKRSEAEINLDAIRKGLKIYYAEMAEFPKGSAPLTPSAPCCEGPNHKCAASPAEWTGNEVWSKLDFEVDEPSYFQYTFDSDGTKVTATAVGDLDCDGTTVTYTLTGETPGGNPSFTLTKPATAD